MCLEIGRGRATFLVWANGEKASEWQGASVFCREGTGEGVHVGGGPRPNSFALSKRGEERGDEVGLVLVRLAIEAWRIGGTRLGRLMGSR